VALRTETDHWIWAKAIEKILRKKITKALIDHRNINSVSGGTLEVYERPKQFKEIGVIYGIKIAEVVKPEHKEFFNFLETVCINNGYGFSIFIDKKSALKWLLES
jgi:phosphatidylserine decarboxylase